MEKGRMDYQNASSCKWILIYYLSLFYFLYRYFCFIKQSDVADGVMKILHNKDIKGVTYDFVG